MERTDLKSELLLTLRGKPGQKVVTVSGKVQFRCPRHDDKTPSAWLGDYRWGCFACGFEERLDTLCDELGVARPSYGLTVEQYAERKGFTLDRLTKYGVHTGTSDKGGTVVVIPYRDAEGRVLRNKLRGPKGSWWEGSGLPTYLYGLDMLAKAPKTMPVIVVEGESDCHACWHRSILAVGVPGANGWRKDWETHLAGRQVYVWQEPDQGGAALVKALGASFPGARVISPEGTGVKDLAELYAKGGTTFDRELHALMERATPITASPTVPFVALVGEPLERLVQEKLQPIDALPMPLPTWNTACRGAGGGQGLPRGWTVIVAGNTGTGKTLVALNVASSAVEHGHRVGFVSMEMAWGELATRQLAITTRTPITSLEHGSGFDPAAHRAANSVMAEFYARGGAIYVNQDELNRLEDIEASMRYLVQVQGCRLIVIDYLQLAWVDGARNMLDRIVEVSHTVRRLTRELNCTTLALSQFNRETSAKRDEPPIVQGLMGGSPLENDATQILMLDHSTYEARQYGAYTKLLLDKNRHGPCREIHFEWDYRTLTMHEVEPPTGENH
jgi:hypothetical protein